MKKIILSTLYVLCAVATSFGQVPQSLNYQAVARDATGTPLPNNTNVNLRFSIHDLTALGSVVYKETHITTTNQFGLVTAKIGMGNINSRTFAGVNWASGDKHLQVEISISGGAYTDMGTAQLMSVPYALHSKYAEQIIKDTATGYVHIDTIGNYIVKNNNGIHSLYDISSSNEIYNSVSGQIAIVGANKDNHAPLGANDTRALMVHNDALRHLTKAVVCEPGELNISVQNDSLEDLNLYPFLATIQLKDSQKEVLISNSYANPLQKNSILLTKDATVQSFTSDNGSTYRAFLFDGNGLKLIKNNIVVSSVDMNGNASNESVTIKDVLNITPSPAAPSNPVKGTIYFDAITNKLMVYDGTIWQACW